MALTKVTGQVIKNTTDVTVGVLTVTNTLAVGGTVSIGGTLTYEDVTNVDAVGIITARSNILVGSGITLSPDGDVFATGISTFSEGFAGDILIDDKIVHRGDTNTAIRFADADTITAETGGSERARITSGGNLLVGATTVRTNLKNHNGNATTPKFQFETANVDNSNDLSLIFGRNNSFASEILLGKHRGATVDSNTIVQSGDRLGGITFSGSDGANFIPAAYIQGSVDGTPGTNDMPGTLQFFTTADGESTPSERLRISSAGLVGIGTAAPTHNLDIHASGNTYLKLLRSGYNPVYIGNAAGEGVIESTGATFIKTGGSERFRIASDGVITAQKSASFGNTTDSFTAVNITSSTSGISELRFADTTANAGFVKYEHSNNALIFATNATETARIDSDGRLLIGQSTQYAGAFGSTPPKFSVSTTVASPAIFGTFSNNAYGSRIDLLKSRNATIGSHTIVQDGDSVGDIVFAASDGDQFHAIAEIKAMVDGTPGDNDTPGRLQFQTTSDGGSSTANRMTIDSNGHVTKPYQPFFSVYGTGSNVTYNEGDEIDFENATHNVGSHFKMTSGTGQYKRFIAPVAGVYIFTFGFFPNSSSNCRISLAVNGSVQTNPYISGCFTAWGTGVSVPMGSQMLKLSANDYVTVQVQIGTLSNTYDGHTGFQGFLLG